jgi:S1-C subfamily serine protease
LARDVNAPEKLKGVLVSQIAYGGPADRAGLARGDIILEVDRKPTRTVEDFNNLVKEKKSYLLRVRRQDPQGGESFSVIVLDLR